MTGTTFVVSGEELSTLPVDQPADVVRLKAGVTQEGNVRGGKATEVLYLVDGLPVQDVLTGGLSANLPTSSIVGLSIYTGGFEPEYGNALSGVVNIVTKTGTNDHHVLVRADKDGLFGGTQTSRTNEFEFSVSGPVVENRLYYFGSVDGVFADTRWWQDFQYFFPSPVDKSISGFGKVEYLFTPTFRINTQVLYCYHDWRDYEFNWRYNLGGLPPERRTSYRVAGILTHSPTENFFYTASISRFSLNSRIGTGSTADFGGADPYQYDFFLRYIIDGRRSWLSMTSQETYTAKIDGTLKVGRNHLLKFGGDLTFYNLKSNLIKYEPKKTYFGRPLVNEPQLNFSTSFAYHPRSGSVYVQDKIDLFDEGVLLNPGIRFDFLDPTASRPAIEAIPVQDTAYSFSVQRTTPASVKSQISPRLGAAMQLTENSYLFVNLGWYFQFPLFDYLYTGLDRVALARGISALTGNPDLEPERTKAYEISLKQSFEHNIVGSITYFRKETANQIDTKTFIQGDSKLAGSFGFAEYVNNPFANASGIELVISRERGEWVTGEISYTYMTAEGTSGSAEDRFYVAQYGLPPATRVYPLSWDQRHTVKTMLRVVTPWVLNLTAITEWHSGRPYTYYPSSTGFEKVDGGLFRQNNSRLPTYFIGDIKIEKYFGLDWLSHGRMRLYLDIRNVANAQNVAWVDSNGKVGGELGDPSGYYIGRRTNVGVQVEF